MAVEPNTLTALEFSLLNDYQRNFPLVPSPFQALADTLGVDAHTVIGTLQSLQARGYISRVGGVFRPNVVGVSALAALAVPPARLEQVAAWVSACAEVNHNYQREHRYNLWFVAAAADAHALQAVWARIAAHCACGAVLVLPLAEQFHIDLGFALDQPHAQPHATNPAAGMAAQPGVAALQLKPEDRDFIARLQQGLPWVAQPYAALGRDEGAAISLLAHWLHAGVLKRFGVVVRHHELGYTANAMVVWDVPDAEVSALGRAIAASGCVSLCYRRPRQLPQWPYNLFCMLHGKDRSAVEARIAALEQACAMPSYPREVLFSTRRFKQCGARYGVDAAGSAYG